MDSWSRLDPVGMVGQMPAGLDAYSLIKMIVKRAQTVRRNRYQWQQLAQHAETIGRLLPQVLQRTQHHTEIDDALGKLEETLREALMLVSSCQGSSYLRRFLRSDRQAEQFQGIRDKIDFYLQVFPLISHIDTSRRIDRFLDAVESTQTQNITRSSSSLSGRLSWSSTGNEDYSTEHFALHGEDSAGFSVFDFSLLANATNNFSLENKIGEGGFGRVYEGRLRGLVVAIKRCFVESSTAGRLSDFENEIKFIPKLQHRNIVRLLGYCIHGKERILVYEYMRNKSLDKIIFGQRNRESLNWDKLFRIIIGIAQGVAYLHLHSGLNIIHRDLKLSNILLDPDMNPKISDFGTARVGPPDKSQKADTVTGTHGYMAPEYSSKGIFSSKSDVFSFGSLLLETISGKRNKSTSYSIRGRKSLSLHDYAWDVVFVEKSHAKLIHTSLWEEASPQMAQIIKCAHVALLCVQEDPADRPSMWDALLMLSGGADVGLPTPKQPTARQLVRDEEFTFFAV